MKRMAISLVILVAIFSSNIASSQETIIAVADLDRALRVSNYSLKQYKGLQADVNYKKLIDKINSVRAELELMEKDGETKSLTWSAAQKKAHVQKGQSKVAEINNLAGQEAAVRNQLDASIQRKLAPKVEGVVNQIIEEKSITLLLKAQAVHFYTPTFDISEEIVKRLNSAE
jgi:Skp family chaperone for outer membrane proteins